MTGPESPDWPSSQTDEIAKLTLSAARSRKHSRGRAIFVTGLTGVVALSVVILLLLGASTPRKAWTCVSAVTIQTVSQWGSILGRPVNCALVFTDNAVNWQSWSKPWILGDQPAEPDFEGPDFDWASWYDQGHDDRYLIISQNLFPNRLRGSDWLARGASGAYEGYARSFARNLVAAGMGDVVIRLAHEANGDTYADSIPDTAAGDAQWVRFWDDTVTAMRSVPGAHFVFDWCVNAGYRDIPLADFYPGDRYVNVIGVDAYDSNPQTNSPVPNRLKTILNEPDGLYALRAFARVHHKLLSIPEWGIGPKGQGGADGDDPDYVAAIAHVVKSGGVLYQSLFTDGVEGAEMLHSPNSLQAYRRAFGG
jgi:hypothetical protein